MRNPGKVPGHILLYGVNWPNSTHPLEREFKCIQLGGRWPLASGGFGGMGMLFHYKKAISIIWPEIKFHKWNELIMEKYFENRSIGIIGAASTGKTSTGSLLALMDYYTFPVSTTIIICSTTTERLQDRIFGEIKRLHRKARLAYPHLPGHLIEGRMRIITDTRAESSDGRDFRNGIVGVPCKKGEGTYIGLGDFAGIKNTRVRLFGDELSLLPRVFVDAVSNLDKNPDFKAVGMGNPKDTMDALGIFCEPSPSEGGWEGGRDQEPGTKTWRTKRPDGICIQLPASDSPNLDGKLGIPLITQKNIDDDVAFYGRDSVWVTMMDEGRMPRGHGTRRVLTRQMCYKFKAMDEPIWRDANRTKIAACDSAFGGVGGDRCIFLVLEYGQEAHPGEIPTVDAIINRKADATKDQQIMALIAVMNVPIKNDARDEVGNLVSPEDQITAFCRKQCEQRGVPPQNFFYDAGMRTSLVNSLARLWTPLVQSVDFGGSPSSRKVSVDIPILCKDYYSKFVTELWFSVRHVIESGQFRGMTEEVMNEGCARQWDMVGANKIELETKAKMKERIGRSPDLFDALCFTEDTFISTVSGEKKISEINVGDLIITPMGISPVATIHCHPINELTKVSFSNGAELIGTGAHKIFTNKGWIRLDTLTIDMEIDSVQDVSIWQLLNLLFTRDTDIGFKAMVDIIHETKDLVLKRDFFTESFGKSTTGLFLRATASIIKMGIGAITGLKTLNWLNPKNINPTIYERGRNFSSGLLKTLLHLEESRLLNGMEQKRELLGTARTGKIHGLTENYQTSFAWTAERHLKLPFHPDHYIVPTLAESDTDGHNIKTCLGLALCAIKSLWRIAMKRHSIVPVTVRQLQSLESKKVYNLTLEKHNAYYANGILVANCIGVEGARQRGFEIKRLGSPKFVAENNKWKRELTDRASKLWSSGVLDHAA